MATALGELLDAIFPLRCWLCGAQAVSSAAPASALSASGAPSEPALGATPESTSGEAVDWACAEHALPGGARGPRCSRCAVLLPRALPDGARCPDCRRRAFGVARTLALFDWRTQPAVHPWVFALKYGGRRDLALPLGVLLGRAFARRAGAQAGAQRTRHVFTHVPLHPRRRFERGYDQAELLALHAARAAGVDLLEPPLTRVRASAVQGGPGAVSRRANLRGAFRWSAAGRSGRATGGRSAGPPGRAPVRGAGREPVRTTVWLVDDVITSGASVAEAARALRRGGLRAVSALALVRAGSSPEHSRPTGAFGPRPAGLR